MLLRRFRQAFSECEPKGTEVPLPIMPSCLRSRMAKVETSTSHKGAQTEQQKLPDAFGWNRRHQRNDPRVGAFVNQIDRRFANFDRREQQMRGNPLRNSMTLSLARLNKNLATDRVRANVNCLFKHHNTNKESGRRCPTKLASSTR